jgi:hypothetical protein
MRAFDSQFFRGANAHTEKYLDSAYPSLSGGSQFPGD